MNMLKTTMLLAALTALFMALGYTLGGSGGAVISLLVAAGMNLFTYWNADKIVLKMHNAREVDAASEPSFHGMVANLARRANMPMPRVFKPLTTPCMSETAIGSIPEKGSSRRRNDGEFTSALAISTLLLSPPERA